MPSKIKIKQANSSKLEIVDFGLDDYGVYECGVYNHGTGGGLLLAKSQLELSGDMIDYHMSATHDLPKLKIQIDDNKSNRRPTVVAYGSTVKVNCHITNNKRNLLYSLEWIRTNDFMGNNTFVSDSSLIIESFDRHNLGEYVCLVTSQMGQTQAWIKFYDQNGSLVSRTIESENETTFEEASAANSNGTIELDERLKFLFASNCFKIGNPIAIECNDLCNF
jgi:hypothetical protein